MLALALTMVLQAADAPVVAEPPPPPAVETRSFADPERAKLEYELSLLKRDRPNLGFSVTMMASRRARPGVRAPAL